MAPKISALTKLGLFFPVVCFICVFDQTSAEQLYRDKGLYDCGKSLFSHLTSHSHKGDLTVIITPNVNPNFEQQSPACSHYGQ